MNTRIEHGTPAKLKASASRRAALPLAFAILCLPFGTHAADLPVYAMTVKNHHFTPDHFSVPAGQRFRIELTSQDATTDEFESYDLKIEKIVVPGGKISVLAGPLHPGTYKYFDDYHPDLASGTIIVTK